ncbi:uncharacterized protein ACIQIH_007494 isoform 2-T2 [Cyanocitta cristata]
MTVAGRDHSDLLKSKPRGNNSESKSSNLEYMPYLDSKISSWQHLLCSSLFRRNVTEAFAVFHRKCKSHCVSIITSPDNQYNDAFGAGFSQGVRFNCGCSQKRILVGSVHDG